MAKRTGPPGFFGTLWRMALVGAVLFVAAGAAGYGVVTVLVKTPETQAPDLLTLEVGEAVRKASDEGFAVRISKTEPSSVLESGRIAGQSPLPGDWVKAGGTIVLVVAE